MIPNEFPHNRDKERRYAGRERTSCWC